MNPESSPQQQNRPLHVPQRGSHDATQDSVAEVARAQLHHIYENDPPNQPAHQKAVPSPYNRTHQENFDWRKYHSAWQQYYQQYYQRYYWQQLHTERQKLAAEAATRAMQQEGTTAPDPKIVTGTDPTGAKEQRRKMEALKQDLTAQVKERAKKVRRSHHFIPILSAVAVGLIFLFLQFNSIFVAHVKAYVSPGELNNDAVVIDPTTNVKVGPEPRLIIPKINVDVPVDYNVQTIDEAQIQTSLRDGATYYNLPGANAKPGQYGNTAILGHSGNDIFNQGQYKFVFVLLDRLNVGDVYYLHYNGTRYIYKVTEKKVINPTEVKALQIGNAKPMSTLITCTPPGTALNRLLIFGEQISPNPAGDTQPAEPQQPQDVNAALPGPQPSILEQIWGYFF